MITNKSALIELLSIIHERRGFDFTQYKEGTVLRRIESRMRQHNLASLQNYARLIRDDPKEMEALISAMSINVTDFFRNPESFEAIDKIVIPRVIAAKKEHQHKLIRAWSCGCSTGDEPCSLAILLLEKLGPAREGFTLRIIGTDIDEEALNEARSMKFQKERLKAVDDRLLKKYFERAHDNNYRLNRNVGMMVQFRHNDIVRDRPITHCDMILCRNLLIYFNKQLQEEILLKFYECLEPGGYLVLGMVESLIGSAASRFETVDNRLRIYRRPEDVQAGGGEQPLLSQDEIDRIVKEMLK